VTVEVILEDPRWEALDLASLARASVDATLADAALDPASYEVALLGCDDARIAGLNGEFRSKRRPTNVLSWPSERREPGRAPLDPELGDIAIAYETCVREAEAQGKALPRHVTHLLVHATLHLLGHDHDREERAERMERAERRICATLGVPNPYADDIS
jgi:probable rRNA maturation factor